MLLIKFLTQVKPVSLDVIIVNSPSLALAVGFVMADTDLMWFDSW